jgi:anti-anti-sigma regulatory factor
MQLESFEGNILLHFDKIVDVSNSEAYLKILFDALERSSSIWMEMEEVVVIDLESIQLLLAFKKTAEQKNCQLIWKNTSAEFITMVHCLGVANALGVPTE